MVRIAGGLYLGTIVAGIYAEMVVRGSLIVRDNAAATVQAISKAEPLFRAGLMADLAMLTCYIGVTALFYVMFRPVSRLASLMAAMFSLIGIAILAADTFFLLIPLRLLDASSFITVIDTQQREALALLSLGIHGDGYDVSLMFFGVYCLLLGGLIWRSGFLPKTIGALMALAGFCYLLNSGADLGMPVLSDTLPPQLMYPTLIGEAVLALWLLIFGAGNRRRAIQV
jgi:hypothetical protein